MILNTAASFFIALAAVTGPPDAYRQEIEQWRKAREARLAAEGGWLSVVGLDWLAEGENRFGADSKNAVVFPKGPALAGVLVLAGGKVTVKPEPGAGLTLNGEALSERVLRVDADGKPDVLRLGSLAFHIIKRGDRFAVRLKDAEAPARLAFKGVRAFPVKASHRVEGTFIPYDPPKEIPIASVIGTTELMQCPGKVVFRLGGRTLSLEPVLESGADSELFFIFRDRTSGRQTYPAGRFLYTALPKDGKVVLDFNKAVNPPCAFTAYATCPLPPRQNALAVPVRAGELNFGGH
jgi:hypothetical protein